MWKMPTAYLSIPTVTTNLTGGTTTFLHPAGDPSRVAILIGFLDGRPLYGPLAGPYEFRVSPQMR